nr:hypothetical protein [Haloactinopolyspora sp.]
MDSVTFTASVTLTLFFFEREALETGSTAASERWASSESTSVFAFFTAEFTDPSPFLADGLDFFPAAAVVTVLDRDDVAAATRLRGLRESAAATSTVIPVAFKCSTTNLLSFIGRLAAPHANRTSSAVTEPDSRPCDTNA